MSNDSNILGVFEEVNPSLFQFLKLSNNNSAPLLVSSGGTTSRAAADGSWILDLRKNYQNITYDLEKKYVEIEAGVTMGRLSDFLSTHKRNFPIGLSGRTGMGYILTGGISPLSRSKGLAIDQILEINGFWGNGDELHLSKPTTEKESTMEWKALCGAAVFLGIITKIKLKTHPLRTMLSWTANISASQLSECISQAENWPNSISFQWIWGENIFALAIAEVSNHEHEAKIINLLEKLPFTSNRRIDKLNNMNSLPNLSLGSIQSHSSNYSEVLGLLGPAWQSNNLKVLKVIHNLITKRPNKDCYIASQQLGGLTHLNELDSSFISRDAVWKPWINGAWKAKDSLERKNSLNWMEECWDKLEFVCPGVHLAQIHPHLPWHKREIKSAFKDWLPKLQEIKSIYDPSNLMPPLK
tara:strand:+ start:1678 stop:2913 length:1236 start_codon:yes stop_codon:yes gene_type:complete